MNKTLSLLCFCLPFLSFSQFAPQADQPGTTAIDKDSSIFVGWATAVYDFQRGPQNVSAGATPLADFGDSTAAIGIADISGVVSLGDGGQITLTFANPITNGSGPDFAVFENSFSHTFLELAHVEVSTDGVTYVRIPSESVTQDTLQIGGFGAVNCEEIHNLAGKYIGGYGTPFDLDDVSDSIGIDIDSINYVRVIDVVGSIDLAYGTTDALGNIINDPFPTPFGSGGFDIDGVGVIHFLEPSGTEELYQTIGVFPNPTSGILHIHSQGGNLRLFDLSGRLIYQDVATTQFQLNLNDLGLQPGIYLLELNGAVERVVLK